MFRLGSYTSDVDEGGGGDPVVAVCDDRDNVHTKLLENQRPRTAQEHGGETSSKQTQPFILCHSFKGIRVVCRE